MNSSMSSSSSSASASMKYPPTFYLNSRMLPSHINRTVRLVGKVVQLSPDGTRAQIEACDGGIVNIVRLLGSENYYSKFVCITGILQPDLTIRESISESFGDSFSICFF